MTFALRRSSGNDPTRRTFDLARRSGKPPISEIELHVISLRAASRPRHARELLDGAELARWQRYRRPIDGERFATGRHLLRTVLAARLGVSASRLVLGHDDGGRLTLVDPPAALALSVSHGGGLVAVAVGDGAIGVDVEPTGVPPPPLLIARTCSPAELAELAGVPSSQRSLGFTRLWARKEAICKASGASMASAHLLDVRGSPVDAGRPRRRWFLCDVAIPGFADHALAVASQRPARVRLCLEAER